MNNTERSLVVSMERERLIDAYTDALSDIELISLDVWNAVKSSQRLAFNFQRIFTSNYGSMKLRERLAASLLAKLPMAFEDQRHVKKLAA